MKRPIRDGFSSFGGTSAVWWIFFVNCYWIFCVHCAWHVLHSSLGRSLTPELSRRLMRRCSLNCLASLRFPARWWLVVLG